MLCSANNVGVRRLRTVQREVDGGRCDTLRRMGDDMAERAVTEPAVAEQAAAERASVERALVDEAMKRSDLIWVELDQSDGSMTSRAVWHVWVEGHGYLLTGGGEQPDPGLREGRTIRVVVRSKDTRQRLVTFDADVSRLAPDDVDWESATAELAKSRLNLAAPEGAATRWATAADVVLYRLDPTGRLIELPGGYHDDARLAAPVDSPATTRSTPADSSETQSSGRAER